MKKLYDYQRRAVNSTKKQSKGIVCMPTGVGKTFCQASMVARDIQKNPNEFRLYVVNAPRILLSYQLLREVYSFLLESNIIARYSFVHSGSSADETELENIRTRIEKENDIEIPFSQIGATLNVEGITTIINKAKQQNLPLILFSTYNSAEKIEVARQQTNVEIAMVLNDEAHYLVQERFYDILNTLKANRCYFFTATMIHTPSDNGRGMNNEESYGKVLYEMLPVHAIRIGKMVRPRLHFVTTENIYNTDDYNKSLNKIIVDVFEQHTQVLKKTNQTPKLLISTRGTQDIIDFINSNEYTQLRCKGVDVYVVSSSENVGNRINDEEVRRQEFLKRLKQDGEDKTKKILVMHYDILAEGIDVSGFTGIMPLRTLNKSKFLQTYGRSARPDKDDRPVIDAILKAKEKGKKYILSSDWDKMNKPYSYIIVPNITHTNEDDKENTIQLITELRNYGFKPYEDIIGTQITKGEIDVEEPDIMNEFTGTLKKVGVLVDRLIAELEAERLANMSNIELAKELLK